MFSLGKQSDFHGANAANYTKVGLSSLAHNYNDICVYIKYGPRGRSSVTHTLVRSTVQLYN